MAEISGGVDGTPKSEGKIFNAQQGEVFRVFRRTGRVKGQRQLTRTTAGSISE